MKQVSKYILRIQYASNLNVHTKTLKEAKALLKPIASDLALLGDIGQAKCTKTLDFIKWCSDTYERVYWAPGYTELAGERTWFQQSDAIQEDLHKANLTNVCFGSKRNVYLSYPSVQVLMGTLWSLNKPLHGIQTVDNKGNKVPLTPEDVKTCCESDMDWYLIKTSKSHVPVIWMSYTTPFMTLGALNHPSVLAHPKLLCSLMGSHYLPMSYSGKLPLTPWVGLNMHGYWGYRPDAFWEYDERRGQWGDGVGVVAREIQEKIRASLTQPTQDPLPALLRQR